MKLFLLFLAACIGVSLSVTARASLGDFAMSGSHQTTANGNFSVHEITTAAGVTVREYASNDGRVFAITWRGGVKPDLKTLLNGYHAEYTQGMATKPKHHGHGQERFSTSNLVVEHSGHMRDLRGRIFLPQKLPSGVTEGDIQ